MIQYKEQPFTNSSGNDDEPYFGCFGWAKLAHVFGSHIPINNKLGSI